jgi:hypothetical protein
MDIHEWIDEAALVTKYCNTLSMAADIGTKALRETQFVFCRDLMNGYALAMAGGPAATSRPVRCASPGTNCRAGKAAEEVDHGGHTDNADTTTRY